MTTISIVRRLSCSFWIVAALLIIAPPSYVNAQSPQACIGDVRTLCEGVQPGGGRIASCIKTHFIDLTVSCRRSLAKFATAAKSCFADFKSLCGNVRPGGGRWEACARARLAQASDPCKAAMSTFVSRNK